MLKNLDKRIAVSAALRHGVNCPGLLIWEDQSEFDAHVASTVASLRPHHPMLTEMAEEIAWMSWLIKRNKRATEIFELCDPFGRLLVDHRGDPDEAISAARELIARRDNELETVANVARKLDSIADSADNKTLKKLAQEISDRTKTIENRISITADYFLGLGDEIQKQADRAIDLQVKLQKMYAEYFKREQWLVTREKLIPQLAPPQPLSSVNDLDKEMIEEQRQSDSPVSH